MIEDYTEAANKLSMMAENCEDPKLSTILSAGMSRVLKLANDSGLTILKVASKIENKEKQ